MKGPIAIAYRFYVVLVMINLEGKLEKVQIFRLSQKKHWLKCPTQKVKRQVNTLMKENEKRIIVYGFQNLEVVISYDDDFVKSIRLLYGGCQVKPTIRDDVNRFINML